MVNLQTDEERVRAQAVLAAVREAVDFLLWQELARFENSVAPVPGVPPIPLLVDVQCARPGRCDAARSAVVPAGAAGCEPVAERLRNG